MKPQGRIQSSVRFSNFRNGKTRKIKKQSKIWGKWARRFSDNFLIPSPFWVAIKEELRDNETSRTNLW